MLKDLIAQILTDCDTLALPITDHINYDCKIAESPVTIKMALTLFPMDIIDLMQKGSIQAESITIKNKEFITLMAGCNEDNN